MTSVSLKKPKPTQIHDTADSAKTTTTKTVQWMEDRKDVPAAQHVKYSCGGLLHTFFFSSTTDHMVVCVRVSLQQPQQSQGLMCLRLDSLRAGTDWRERMGVGF